MGREDGQLHLNAVELVMSAGRVSQFPDDGLPQVAFSGRSNAGKSSMINKLLNRKALARVSSEPGKTITVNFYQIDRQMYVVDLPGYGYARRSQANIRQWSAIADQYFMENAALKLVVQLVDIRHEPSEEDGAMLDYLRGTGVPFLVAATKADKVKASEKAARLAALAVRAGGAPVTAFSAVTGEGRDELWARMAAAAGVTAPRIG